MTRRVVPDWVRSAVHDAPWAGWSAAASPVARGEIRRVGVAGGGDVSGDGRLVVILDLDEADGLASVMLMHADPEIRTDKDVLVPRHETGLPFDLCAETDLVGPIALEALSGPALGRIAELLLEDLIDASVGDVSADALVERVGMPLRGPGDARWDWKLAEGEALHRLLAASEARLAPPADPVVILADALRALGGCGDRPGDWDTVTDCLLAHVARREALPANVIPLLSPILPLLGNDMTRAIGPILLVA